MVQRQHTADLLQDIARPQQTFARAPENPFLCIRRRAVVAEDEFREIGAARHRIAACEVPRSFLVAAVVMQHGRPREISAFPAGEARASECVNVVAKERAAGAERVIEAVNLHEYGTTESHIGTKDLHLGPIDIGERLDDPRFVLVDDGERPMAGIEQFDAATGISDLAIVENLQNAVDIIGRQIAIIIGEADDVTARDGKSAIARVPTPASLRTPGRPSSAFPP